MSSVGAESTPIIVLYHGEFDIASAETWSGQRDKKVDTKSLPLDLDFLDS